MDLVNGLSFVCDHQEEAVKVYQLIGAGVKAIISWIAYIVAGASAVVKFSPTIKREGRMLKIIKFIARYIALQRMVPDQEIRQRVQQEEQEKVGGIK